MKKKKKKHQTAWDRLNGWLIRYKAIISLFGIGTFIGLFGIWISLKDQQITEQQYINSLKPNWEVELVYLPNNVDLLEVIFKSINPNITLQKLSFFRINDEGNLLVTDHFSNSWKVQNFSNDLITYTFINSPVNTVYSKTFETGELLNWDSCYPIAFQFNYIINGESKILTSLYKVHFRLIKQRRLKIKGLEFVETLPNNSRNYMEARLIDLNRKSCAGKQLYQTEMLIDSIKALIPYYSNIDSLIHLGHYTTRFLSPNDHVPVPNIVCNKEDNKNFNNTLDVALGVEDTYDSALYNTLKGIKQLLEKNPVCNNFEESCIIRTGWSKEDTYYAYNYLMLQLDVQLQNACEREKEKLREEQP